MGLFFGTDYLNDRSKKVHTKRNAYIDEWLPYEERFMDMSVFGGDNTQRTAATIHAISRMYGECGIIVIHNNELLERCIYNFKNIYPQVAQSKGSVDIGMVSGTNKIYDPFCGMRESDVVACIYSQISSDCSMRAEGLRQYLRILKGNNIHLTLQNLNRLCGMSLDKLENELLSNLSSDVADDIMSILIQNNLHMQVKADVKLFADKMQRNLWDDDTPPTGISMISAVNRNALLSIKVASNDIDVLNYLAAECQTIINGGYHFLLIVDSLLLGTSGLLGVMRNPSAQYVKMLVGPNHMEMLQGSGSYGNELPDSLAQKIILFALTNQALAENYSNMIGKYIKIEESFSENQGKESLFFGGFNKENETVSRRETSDARVSAEELTGLGRGAVMIRRFPDSGYRNTDVEITRNLELPYIC